VLSVSAPDIREGLGLGDSVCVDGACLTITQLDPQGFTVGLAPETLRRTGLGEIKAGARVNLERAVPVGGRLGGHIVQGHVDGVVRILAVRPEGDSIVVSLEAPESIGRYIVEKGFVALDGISLTVTSRAGQQFSVALVPYTQTHVGLSGKSVGDTVNVEVDILAKYVESILAAKTSG
jgi:riboflavin synthase